MQKEEVAPKWQLVIQCKLLRDNIKTGKENEVALIAACELLHSAMETRMIEKGEEKAVKEAESVSAKLIELTNKYQFMFENIKWEHGLKLSLIPDEVHTDPQASSTSSSRNSSLQSHRQKQYDHMKLAANTLFRGVRYICWNLASQV